MDFAASLEEFGRKAEKIAVPDHETKKKMTAAGAEVLVSKLKEVTQEKHYQPGRKTGKVKHLADSIIFENKDMGDVDNGNSLVGFKGPKDSGINHARIARFLNDGTVKMRGDHFIDNTRRDAKDEVFEAQAKVYRGQQK